MKLDAAAVRPCESEHAPLRGLLWLGLLWSVLAVAGCAAPVLAPNLGDTGLPAQIELSDTPFFPQEAYHCGPAALATVLDASAVSVTPVELVDAVYLPQRRGALQAELVATVRRYDRVPYVIEPTLETAFAELAAGRPVLVMQNLSSASTPVWHYAVLVGYSMTDDTVVLRSGTEPRQVMSARHFLGTWARADGWALVTLRPGELPAQADRQRYVEAVAAMEGVASGDVVLTAYEAALRRWPDDLTAQFGKANTLYALGDRTAAEQTYRRLLSQEPEHVATRNNLATLLGERGCYQQALALLEPALSRQDVPPGLRAALEDTERTLRAGLSAIGSVPGESCSSADSP